MKVVYVTTIERGGPISHLRTLAPAVAAKGVGVWVVCASDDVATSFRDAGVEAVVVPVRSKFDVRGARRLWPHVHRADVVHTHDRRAGLFARPAARLGRAPAVHTLHGVPEEIAVTLGGAQGARLPGTSPARAAWMRWGYPRLEALLGRLGHIVVPSRALASFLVDHGFPNRRVHVIPHGLAAPPAVARTHERPELRLVTAANLEYWKGIDVLLDACARLDRRLRLDVFGDGSLRDELREQASRRRVDAHFHGFVPDVQARLASADVFVLPSRGDNAPMAVLEAMASGLPVVATRVGGVPELVRDGETGILVPADDPAALAAAVERLAGDRSLRSRLGEAGFTRVTTEFSLDRAVSETVRLYEELCESCT
jgi:glycosyltransferase involved in cell wall biosynthesis